MKIDPLEPNDDWLADEYWGPDQDEPEEESDEEEFIEQSEVVPCGKPATQTMDLGK